eukprot:774829-Pelagomonas_calceolata.AAC.2
MQEDKWCCKRCPFPDIRHHNCVHGASRALFPMCLTFWLCLAFLIPTVPHIFKIYGRIICSTQAQCGLACLPEAYKKRRNHVGRGNSPYINGGKGDTLAQKSHESPPPLSCKKKHVSRLIDGADETVCVYLQAAGPSVALGGTGERSTHEAVC